MFEELIKAIDSTDWISNWIQIGIGGAILIPIIYATQISKKVEESLRELKEMARQSRKSNLLKLQSDFPIFYRALDDFEWEYNKLLNSINDFNFKQNLSSNIEDEIG